MYRTLYRTLDESQGNWVSYRNYLYGKNTEPKQVTNNFSLKTFCTGHELLVKEFGEEHIGPGFEVQWNSKSGDEFNKGYMLCQIRPNCENNVMESGEIWRNRGFFSEEPTMSSYTFDSINRVLTLLTSYDGLDFAERIEFIEDHSRLRNNKVSRRGHLTILGAYIERRLPSE